MTWLYRRSCPGADVVERADPQLQGFLWGFASCRVTPKVVGFQCSHPELCPRQRQGRGKAHIGSEERILPPEVNKSLMVNTESRCASNEPISAGKWNTSPYSSDSHGFHSDSRQSHLFSGVTPVAVGGVGRMGPCGMLCPKRCIPMDNSLCCFTETISQMGWKKIMALVVPYSCLPCLNLVLVIFFFFFQAKSPFPSLAHVDAFQFVTHRFATMAQHSIPAQSYLPAPKATKCIMQQ